VTLSHETRDQSLANAILTMWRILSSMRMALMPMEKLIRVAWVIQALPPELRDTIRKEAEKRALVKDDNPGKF
jgi:hypothetical protein